MVDSINWKIKNNTKYSIIVELFFGQYIIKVMTPDHKLLSKNFEAFNMMTIPIHGMTLYDSLSKYFEKETLESKYFNETDNTYVDAYRQIRLMEVPKFLIIVLKRYNNQTNSLSKTHNSITFPINDLDLSQYSEGYDRINCSLKLISVCCHTGGLNGGHYYAICRHPDNKWYKHDDETVTEFNIEMNEKTLFKFGYILIYEKNDD